MDTPSFGSFTVDVAFYAYLDADQLGLAVTPSRLRAPITAGDEIERAVTAAKITHPVEPELRGVHGTILASQPENGHNYQRNVCIFVEREVDRSPTGTAIRVAPFVARGRLRLGGELRNEPIIGSTFTGRAVERTTVGPFEAVAPEAASRAAINGHATCRVEECDEFGNGLFLQ